MLNLIVCIFWYVVHWAGMWCITKPQGRFLTAVYCTQRCTNSATMATMVDSMSRYEQQLHTPFGQFSLYTAQTRKSFNRCRILVSPNMLLLFSYIIWNHSGRIEASPFSHSPFLCCKDLGFGVKKCLEALGIKSSFLVYLSSTHIVAMLQFD
jgi:hypothetical protein